MKSKILPILLLCSSFSAFAGQYFPSKVTSFRVYATEKIDYSLSDFQGVVGAGKSITLSRFGVLDDPRNYKNPFFFSVITKNFSLTNGSVYQGGVIATDSLKLRDAGVNGALISQRVSIRNNRHSETYSETIAQVPAFNKYKTQLLNLQNKYLELSSSIESSKKERGGYNFKAVEGDGTLDNIFVIDNLDTNISFKGNSDKRERFIIVVNSKNYVTDFSISFIDFKLGRSVSPNNILFVFPHAESLYITMSGTSDIYGQDLRIGIPGSILAANADVTFENGLITGSLFAKNIYGGDSKGGSNGGQVNPGSFSGF